MLWKTVLFSFLVVGALPALAEFEVSENQRTQMLMVLTQYCTKNGAPDHAPEVEKAVKTFVDCAKGLVNPEQLKKEVEEAKPNGALDEVFKKYCAKTPELKTCVQTLATAVAPCMEPQMRDNIGEFTKGVSQLLDFVCYKDGDRIALFIAEGGPECIEAKTLPIRECVGKIREQVASMEDAKRLGLSQQCAKFDEMTACMVRALETCSTPTPGNMAEALFKFVRKGTPCATL